MNSKGCEGSIYTLGRHKYVKNYLNVVYFKAMNFFSMDVMDHVEQVGVFFSLSSPYIYASMINKMGIGTLQAFA
jgi:hypothetical protein